jgi:hypothetical protein
VDIEPGAYDVRIIDCCGEVACDCDGVDVDWFWAFEYG